VRAAKSALYNFHQPAFRFITHLCRWEGVRDTVEWAEWEGVVGVGARGP